MKKLLLTASLLMITTAANAADNTLSNTPVDSDSIPKARSIPYTKDEPAAVRDPFQLPREARNNKALTSALNRKPLNNSIEDLNAVEPASGK